MAIKVCECHSFYIALLKAQTLSSIRMKYLIAHTTILTILFGCSPKKQNQEKFCTEKAGFNICIDTVYLDYDGYLTRIISVDRNKIYCILVKEIKGEFDSDYLRHLLVFEKSGKILSKTALPIDFDETFYYNLNIQNDSLVLIDYRHTTPFYFNEKLKKWKRLEYFTPIVYQDEKYQISSVCQGEFGGLAYFRDKETSNVYETLATCLKSVSKLNGKYYLTNQLNHMIGHSNLTKISSPAKLPIAKRPLKLQSVFDNSIEASMVGAEVIWDSLESNIKYSFVYQDSLYQVIQDSNTIKFGAIKDGKIFNVKTPFDFVTTNFQQQITGNNIVCDFYEKNNKCGLIFYENNELSLFYILQKVKR